MSYTRTITNGTSVSIEGSPSFDEQLDGKVDSPLRAADIRNAIWCTATGTNDLTLTLPAGFAIAEGIEIAFRAPATNTVGMTLDSRSLYKTGDAVAGLEAPLAAGQILQNMLVVARARLVFGTTYTWQVVSPLVQATNDVPALAASKITSGTLATARIPGDLGRTNITDSQVTVANTTFTTVRTVSFSPCLVDVFVVGVGAATLFWDGSTLSVWKGLADTNIVAAASAGSNEFAWRMSGTSLQGSNNTGSSKNAYAGFARR